MGQAFLYKPLHLVSCCRLAPCITALTMEQGACLWHPAPMAFYAFHMLNNTVAEHRAQEGQLPSQMPKWAFKMGASLCVPAWGFTCFWMRLPSCDRASLAPVAGQ